MAPSMLPDPAMHTIYIVDPRDVFTRYSAAYAATARLREGGRAGFLVPARLDYLAFGAVPGYLVTRYVFALIAVGPVYLLLRRLYGRAAGVAGILVIMSSPVLVTAWGTDYPDSAVVSYAAGALACLAMPCARRWRRAWLAAAGVALTLAVWSHGVAVLLAGATLACYLAVRLVRDRAGLAGDLLLLGGVGVAVTGLLAAASAVVLGHADFIGLTWQSVRYLSQPSQVSQWHSANWRWAPYEAYLLVPPAVLAAFAAAVARRGRALPTPVLLVGAATAVQFAVYVLAQFAGTVQTLEEHYFSSTLWAGVCLTFAVAVAELARPLAVHPLSLWAPAAVLLAIPLLYEAAPRVPAFGWMPFGAIAAAAVIAAAVAALGCVRLRPPVIAGTATGLALAVLAGASLVLTVAPIPGYPRLPGTTEDDPAPAYASALGGSATTDLNSYRILTALPAFAGQATYPGEQLLTWQINAGHHIDRYVSWDVAMYHARFNSMHSHSPRLPRRDLAKIRQRRPAEMLLLGTSAASFPEALRQLAVFRPVLMRAGALRAGGMVLHAWVVRLGAYYHPPGRTG
jgi:MFS family permease